MIQRKGGRAEEGKETSDDTDYNEETWISLLEKCQYGSYKILHKSVSCLN